MSASIEKLGTPSQRIGLLILGFLLAAFVAFVANSSQQLPDPVATHFDLHGKANGWMTHSQHLKFSIGVGVGTPLLILGVFTFVRKMKGWGLNIPNKEFWLSPEREQSTFDFLQRLGFWLAGLTLAFHAGLFEAVVIANSQTPAFLSPTNVAWLTGGFIALLSIWIAILLRAFSPTYCMTEKLAQLQAQLRAHAPLLIAYSGGVDSACLLAEAHGTLGGQALGVIADSPSLPRQALTDALALAEKIGANVEVIRTDEFANPEYTANPVNRCYFCKAELFTKLNALAAARGFRAIAYGENADDMRQVRPGRQAAAEFSIIAPLRDAGLTKAEIRARSHELGLPTADAPAQPCLSSRIPHGTPVTTAALAMVEQGEAFVRSLGFRVFRVRHFADHRARVQIAPEEMSRLPELATQIEGGLRAVGYAAIEIDPAGYRSTT